MKHVSIFQNSCCYFITTLVVKQSNHAAKSVNAYILHPPPSHPQSELNQSAVRFINT